MSEETKKCKYCKTEIPKDAKVCPNCRKNSLVLENGSLSPLLLS